MWKTLKCTFYNLVKANFSSSEYVFSTIYNNRPNDVSYCVRPNYLSCQIRILLETFSGQTIVPKCMSWELREQSLIILGTRGVNRGRVPSCFSEIHSFQGCICFQKFIPFPGGGWFFMVMGEFEKFGIKWQVFSLFFNTFYPKKFIQFPLKFIFFLIQLRANFGKIIFKSWELYVNMLGKCTPQVFRPWKGCWAPSPPPNHWNNSCVRPFLRTYSKNRR